MRGNIYTKCLRKEKREVVKKKFCGKKLNKAKRLKKLSTTTLYTCKMLKYRKFASKNVPDETEWGFIVFELLWPLQCC